MRKSEVVDFWLAEQDQLAQSGFILSGRNLDKRDNIRVANAYTMLALLVYDDSKVWGYERDASYANLTRWLGQLQQQPIDFVKEQYDCMLNALRSWSNFSWINCSRRAFKWHMTKNGVQVYELFQPFLWLVYYYGRTFNKAAFRSLNSILQFTSRLTLDCDFLLEEAIETYVSEEASLATYEYDEHLCQELKKILSVLDDELIVFDSAVPRHSGGATAEVGRGQGVAKKWRYCEGNTSRDSRLLPFSNIPQGSRASIVLVPKGINKKRVIAMEPTVNQFWQQKYAAGFDMFFKKYPSFRIDLHRQSYNRDLCMRGSLLHDYGTIDLSSASDSVTLSLVQKIFPPKLLHKLIKHRTTSGTLPDGREVTFRKYAGMGSSVTFPIECLVFSAIVQLAQRHVGVYSYFRIYGDDIVCHESCFQETISLLERLNFKVNTSKTFKPADSFKESCGIECVDGFDVSPIRISRRYDYLKLTHNMSPEAYDGFVSLCNALHTEGYPTVRRFLLHQILRSKVEVLFGRLGIHSGRSIIDTTMKWRYNTSLQRIEYRAHVPYSSTRSVSDDIRYQIVLELMHRTTRTSLRDPLDLIDVRPGATYSSLRRRWVPQDSVVD